MKLLLQSIWLLAATAIPLTKEDSSCEAVQKKLDEARARLSVDTQLLADIGCTAIPLTTKDSGCEDVQKQLDEARATISAEAQALADIGCNPKVDAAAHIQRRDEQPQYTGCQYFHTQLVVLNQGLDTMLNNPSDPGDRRDAFQCDVAHKSLPEIDIWSNKCASRAPAVGREAVNLVNSLQRLGCVWNSTCGRGCFQIGDSMFDIVRNMGPMECNRYDPAGDSHEMDIERLTL